MSRSEPLHSELIDVGQLATLIASNAVAVFDCRFDLADSEAGRAAYRRGHIPGARYLHLDEALAGRADGSNGRHPLPDVEAFAALLAAEGLDADVQVVAYDDSGGPYAARLWWMLRWLGHAGVAVLDGGLQAWIAEGGALEQGDPPAAPPGAFVAKPSLVATVSAGDILATIGTDDLLVVDARTAARFAGAPDPLDPVSGHIPGARNRFWKDNLSPDGRMKSAATLAAEWDAVLGDTPLAKVALQCGSGVTAAHDLLALEVAGRHGAALYPGSWSEWVSDPSRPIERSA